jgi:hypothetical protein
VTLAALHAAATWAMVGIIWFVQLAHYPLFDRVGNGAFHTYHAGHMPRTAVVVAPLMLTELGTAVALVWTTAPGTGGPARLGLALLALVWLSTALLQVPAHRALERGFDAPAHRRLVATNWIRTLAWSARGAVALLLLDG